jgi:hypothetical protein
MRARGNPVSARMEDKLVSTSAHIEIAPTGGGAISGGRLSAM